MGEQMFYVQNLQAGYVGNNPVFWAIGGRGYTSYIDRAEKFSEADARAMVDHDSRKWRMVSVAEVEPHIYRTVECQTLEAERYKKKPKVIEAQERMLEAGPNLIAALESLPRAFQTILLSYAHESRREAETAYIVEDLAKELAAHRLAAERAKTAEIVAKLRERAAVLRFKGFDLDSILYDQFADEIESTT